jgi:hypothetical protein
MSEKLQSNETSHKLVERRSFLKLVAGGLIASITVATGLLQPQKVRAYTVCDQLRCAWSNGVLRCVNGTLYVVQDYYCWDARYGSLCYRTTYINAIGCC